MGPFAFRSHIVLSLVLLGLVVGCGDANRKKLVGIWQLENQSGLENRIASQDKVEKETDRSTGETNSEPSSDDKGDSKMSIEFRANGELLTQTQLGSQMGAIDQGKKGTWKFVGYDAETNSMQIECTLGMQNTEHEVVFDGENTISLMPPNMAGLNLKLTFVRK